MRAASARRTAPAGTWPVFGLELVLLLDGDPRQLPPLLLDPLGVLLELALGRQQLLARRPPLLSVPTFIWTSFALNLFT